MPERQQFQDLQHSVQGWLERRLPGCICGLLLSHPGKLRGPTPNSTSFAVGSPQYTEIAKDFSQETTSALNHVASPQEFEDVTTPMPLAVPEG